MLFKLLLVIGFLFETTHARKVKENVSFSVEQIWQSYQEDQEDECCSCDENDDEWKEGVQQYYDGCINAITTFRGPSHDLADTVMRAIEIYLSKLIYFTNSNSTVLTSSSTAILESLSKLNKCEDTGFVVIKEFDKVLQVLVKDFAEIISKLSNIIGGLTSSVNESLEHFGCTMKHFTSEFIKSSIVGFRRKVDYEPVIKEGQRFMNTVALIAETLLNECSLATRDVYEAVTVLNLILVYVVVMVQGINCCVQSVLFERKFIIPEKVQSCSVTLEYLLVEVTESVASVTFPFAESITRLLTNLVNVTIFLNSTFKDIFGLFEGVTITVGQIMRSLSRNVTGTVTGVTKGLTNILKGVGPQKIPK